MTLALTLRRRLVLLVAAAMVPLLGLSLLNAELASDAALSRAADNLQAAVSLTASRQRQVTETARQVLTALTHLPGVRQGGSAPCDQSLNDLRRQLPDYVELGIIGADGLVLCNGSAGSAPAYAGNRAYFREAVASGRFLAGEFMAGPLPESHSVAFALPVLDRRGAVAFVAYAVLDLSGTVAALAALPLPPSAALGIHDRQGALLAGTPGLPLRPGQKAASPVIQEAVKTLGSAVRQGADRTGQQRLWAYTATSQDAGTAFVVAASVDKSLIFQSLQHRLRLEVAALALMALLGGWLAWRLGARAIVKPANEILQAARQFQAGRLEARVASGAHQPADELSQIGAAFNAMAEALQAQQGALEAELLKSREAQQKLRDAQRVARIGHWQFDAASRALCLSDEICDFLGMEAALFGGTLDSLLACIHRSDRSAFEAACSTAWRTGASLDIEFRVVLPDGQVRWIHQFGLASDESQAGAPDRRCGVMQDITAQHQAHAHARLLEACISRLNDVVMITDAASLDEPGPRIVFVNDAFERLTGYRREEALGRSPRFLQGPGTGRAERDRIREKLQACQPVRAELINYTKSGGEFWIDLNIVPLTDEQGAPTHWVSVKRDITGRKLAERALAHSEQRYAALFEMAPVPMWVYDTATNRYLAVNQAACRAYGYCEAEFLSMSIFDIRPAAEHEALRQWLGKPLQRNAAWHDLRKDGSLFPVATVSQPIRHAGREARFVIAQDMTAQEKTEKDVQEYLFTLQRAADAAQAIIWHRTLEATMQEIADQARGVIGAHQAAVSLTSGGPSSHTLHALSLSEKYEAYRGLMQPAGSRCALQDIVCANNRSVRLTQAQLEEDPDVRGLAPEGPSPLPLRGWLAVPLTDREGRNIGVLQLSDKYEGEFTKQDEYFALELSHLASASLENARLLEEISRLNAGLEQKVAERTAALSRQEALFRALAEQAPQTVWMASPDGRATYYNRAWFELMGGTLEDWTGCQWLAAIHPEDVADVRQAWAVSRDSRSPYAGIRRFRARDGGFHTMSYRATPVLDEQGHVAFWVGIDADVTDIKAAEAALRLSNQELEAFSYSVSHDLRSPLNTIDGFSRLLAKQLAAQMAGNPGAKAGHYLMRIQAGVAQMGQLIEDLLSLSQVSRAPLNIAPVDLSLMARRLLGEWASRQPERQVRVRVEDGLQSHGDERLLGIMMENLLSNAWKFTGKTAQADISVGRQSDKAGVAVFFIRDNGAGFDMAYADKLFQPFQRLHAALEFPGTGVGLATVSRIIRRHAGRIWVESAPALGTTFFFTLS